MAVTPRAAPSSRRPGRALVIALGAALATAGCTATATTHTPATPPPPKLASIVPANYTVTARDTLALVPGAPEAVVVTSAGPGTKPGTPVAGGTGDVQVLVHDPLTNRWNIAFDAADLIATPVGTPAPGPLLDQTTILTSVTAEPVWFAGRPTLDLLISASDETANHPVGIVAVVRFRTGSAEVIWRADQTSTQNMTTPKVLGTERRQRVVVEADHVTATSGACCPVRRYQFTLGGSRDQVRVVEDDRPFLGAWLQPSDTDPAAALVLGVDPNSPATRALEPGDLLLGMADQPTPPLDTLGPAQVNLIAKQHAGDQVGLRIQRDGRTHVVDVTLGSQADSPTLPFDTPPPPGRLGVDLDTATMQLLDVPSGPASDAGLRPGDTLRQVNGLDVATLDDVRTALWGTVGTSIPVVVSRGAAAVTVTVQPEPMTNPDVQPQHI